MKLERAATRQTHETRQNPVSATRPGCLAREPLAITHGVHARGTLTLIQDRTSQPRTASSHPVPAVLNILDRAAPNTARHNLLKLCRAYLLPTCSAP